MAEGEQQQQQQQQQTPPWHQGVDAEIVGHWQNKGWKLDAADSAKTIAIEATKAAREAQKFVGAPPEQLIRLPADAKDEAGWKGVWQRLGAPEKADGYDFSTVKNAAGEPLDAKLSDTLRATAATAHLPKDAATEVAKAVVKHLDGVRAEETAVRAAKLAEEKAALAKNWGANKDINMLHAKTGAEKLGISPEAIAALENQIGYAATMEAMRRVGALGMEDKFVEGEKDVKTQQGAIARLKELKNDEGWQKRLLAGDAATVREWTALETIAAGEAQAA